MFFKSPDCAVVAAENGGIALNKNSGQYFSLNSTAAFILEVLAEGATAEELLQQVTAHFGADSASAQADLSRVLKSFISIGLVLDRP